MSMGVGIAINIGRDIVNKVFSDFDFLGVEKDRKSSDPYTKVHAELSSESCQKKRKHSIMVRSSKEQPAHDVLEVEMSHNLTPIAVKIAAWEALEALLTVGGSMRSESWRGNVDNLLINVATNACRRGCFSEEGKIFLSDDTTSTSADFQLTTLRALLASLLSPGQVRPSHLAVGVELFRRGAQETGTRFADYCARALLALEVLIQPRSLPLVDLHSGPDEYKVLSHKSTRGKGPPEPESEDYDLEENWLRNDDYSEIQITKRQHNDPPLDKLTSVKDASITHLPEKIETTVSANVPNNTTTVSANVPNNTTVVNNDDYMVESLPLRNAVDDNVGAQSGTSAFESVKVEPVTNRSSLVENDIVVNGDGISEVGKGLVSTSDQPTSETKDDRLTAIVERISATLSNSERSKGLIFEAEKEVSDDSLPDIIDGDPDSD